MIGISYSAAIGYTISIDTPNNYPKSRHHQIF